MSGEAGLSSPVTTPEEAASHSGERLYDLLDRCMFSRSTRHEAGLFVNGIISPAEDSGKNGSVTFEMRRHMLLGESNLYAAPNSEIGQANDRS